MTKKTHGARPNSPESLCGRTAENLAARAEQISCKSCRRALQARLKMPAGQPEDRPVTSPSPTVDDAYFNRGGHKLECTSCDFVSEDANKAVCPRCNTYLLPPDRAAIAREHRAILQGQLDK